MADDFALPVLPRPQAALVATGNNQSRGSAYQGGGAGDAGSLRPSSEWYEFFRKLLAFVDANSDIAAEIAALLERLETLEGAQIVGQNSVRSFGSLSEGLVTLMLRGDVATPGDLMYYGTGPTGSRGFWPAASLVTYMTDEDGNYLVDENGDFIIGQDITADLFAIVDTDTPGVLAHTGAGTWQTLADGPGITSTYGEPGASLRFNADTGEVAHLPGATYATVQKALDVMFSPGLITGGEVTGLTSTSVRVLAGTAVLRVLDDNVSQLRFCNFAQTDFSVPDVQVTHFYAVDYNGGSPIVVESTVDAWDRDTQIPLGSAFRLDGALNVTPNPYRVGDVITNMIQRMDAVGPVLRDNSVGGLLLGVAGTRNVTVSAGRLWSRVSDFTVAAKNSSTDTMFSAYFNGVNLTITGGVTQWPNAQYNNVGAGTLVAMGANKYANLWFFMSFDGTKFGFGYGTNEYNTLGDASNEGVPAYFTQNFFNQAILLGRFTFKNGDATPQIIDSAFHASFTPVAINTHNDLGGLQGGAVGNYYHLTSMQVGSLTALSVGSISGLGMLWVSGTALTVATGAAYIESSASVLQSSSAIAKAGLALSASTWYHVYLYSNAGTPDIEIVTTAPAAPFSGTARSKTGDTSRRYIGSIRTTAAGAIIQFQHSEQFIAYGGADNNLRNVLANGLATVATTIALSSMVPVTATNASILLSNISTTRAAATGVPGTANPLGFGGGNSYSGYAGIGNDTSFSAHPMDSSQQINYMLSGASAAGLYVEVLGYLYAR